MRGAGVQIVMMGLLLALSACAYKEPCGPALPEKLRPAPGERIVRITSNDPATLLPFYRCRARMGYEEGQYQLGLAYEQGRGMELDLKKAAYWYDKAAKTKDGMEYSYYFEQVVRKGPGSDGHREAQYRLGLMYLEGRGKTQRENFARLWFGRAIEQGYEPAQRALDKMNEGLREEKN